MDVPDVHYARSSGVAIAYQAVGDGPQTLVFAPVLTDLYVLWLNPRTRSFLDRIASRARVVIINPRGTGLSDRPRNVTLESRMEDLKLVVDDLGVHRASLYGISTGANASALFAATFPERTERLILAVPYPRLLRSEIYPWGVSEEEALGWIREMRDGWGDRDFFERFARDLDPVIAEDPGLFDYFVWQCRLAASPSAAADFARLGLETDITDVLTAIRVPTLVLHRADDSFFGSGPARFVAERIRDCRTNALRSDQGSPFSLDAADLILDFLRGDALPSVPDSVLATILFTDLVSSTERAAALGDRAWRDVLTRHHAAVRSELVRYRGVEMDTAGDGFFCRFDGPARAIACAQRIVEGARDLDLSIRVGVHTGECELVGQKIAGISVVTGARISSLAASGEVLVSSTVKDLVAGSGFAFDERGEHELKGVPGAWRLYAVVDG